MEGNWLPRSEAFPSPRNLGLPLGHDEGSLEPQLVGPRPLTQALPLGREARGEAVCLGRCLLHPLCSPETCLLAHPPVAAVPLFGKQHGGRRPEALVTLGNPPPLGGLGALCRAVGLGLWGLGRRRMAGSPSAGAASTGFKRQVLEKRLGVPWASRASVRILGQPGQLPASLARKDPMRSALGPGPASTPPAPSARCAAGRD